MRQCRCALMLNYHLSIAFLCFLSTVGSNTKCSFIGHPIGSCGRVGNASGDCQPRTSLHSAGVNGAWASSILLKAGYSPLERFECGWITEGMDWCWWCSCCSKLVSWLWARSGKRISGWIKEWLSGFGIWLNHDYRKLLKHIFEARTTARRSRRHAYHYFVSKHSVLEALCCLC